jgi:hypothetical protein
MSTTTFSKEPNERWKPDDPRLLRAAQTIIRLYDLGQITSYSVKPESLANVIARELNQRSDES